MLVWITELGRKFSGTFVIAVGVFVATVILTTTAAQSNNKADKAITNAASIGSAVTQLCNGSQGPQVAQLLRDAKTSDGKPVCDQAGETLRDPTAAPVATTVNFPDARVIALIRAELAKMPPPASSAPSLEQVTAAVRMVMSSDPVLFKGAAGDPGIAPSQAQIAAAVADYFRANAAQFRGKDGADGKDGTNGKDGSDGNSTTVTQTPPTVTETQTRTETAPPNDSPPEQTAPPQETTPEPTATPNSKRQQRGGGLGGLLSPN
jgi:hypothetical protein